MSFQFQTLQTDEAARRKWLNRRGSVRYQCAPATVGKVYSGPREEFVRVWVLDLSRGGAGLLVPRPLNIDTEIAIQIASPSNKKRLEFMARVAHLSEKVTGEWVVGLEFLRPLTDEELDAILE